MEKYQWSISSGCSPYWKSHFSCRLLWMIMCVWLAVKGQPSNSFNISIVLKLKPKHWRVWARCNCTKCIFFKLGVLYIEKIHQILLFVLVLVVEVQHKLWMSRFPVTKVLLDRNLLPLLRTQAFRIVINGNTHPHTNSCCNCFCMQQVWAGLSRLRESWIRPAVLKTWMVTIVMHIWQTYQELVVVSW